MSEWQLIEAYPFTTVPKDDPNGDKWGPEVLVLVPRHKTHFIINGARTDDVDVGPFRLVARLEADMWLSRDGNDPTADVELILTPTHWMPLPDPPLTPPSAATG